MDLVCLVTAESMHFLECLTASAISIKYIIEDAVLDVIGSALQGAVGCKDGGIG